MYTYFTSYKEGCKVSPTWSHLNHLVLSLKQGVGVGSYMFGSAVVAGNPEKITRHTKEVRPQNCASQPTGTVEVQTIIELDPRFQNVWMEDGQMMKNIHIFWSQSPLHIWYTVFNARESNKIPQKTNMSPTCDRRMKSAKFLSIVIAVVGMVE